MAERDRPMEVPGLGIALAAQGVLPGASSADSVTMASRRTSGSSAVSVQSQFFHADEAKPAATPRKVEPRPGLTKASSFFYASDAGSNMSGSENPHASPRMEATRLEGEKFFYANDQVHKQQTAKAATVPRAASPSRQSPRFPSPEVTRDRPQRPPSPLKEASYSSAPATVRSPRPKSITNPGKRPEPNTTSQSAQQQTSSLRRDSLKGAVTTPRKAEHSSTSVRAELDGSTESTPTKRHGVHVSPKGIATQHVTVPTPSDASPDAQSPRSASLGSNNIIFSSLALDTNKSIIHSPTMSPTKADGQSVPSADELQKMREQASNARRERKVLDLEISNSSLLAINKTLEREMRKQNAELRRFRRLTRSGRFSLANGSLRSISVQSTLSTLNERELGVDSLSDLSEHSSDEDDDDDDDDDDADSSISSPTSSTFSPTSAARQRARDEKRLILDLSKHQQLLVDWQKMSQSIKRCVSWTEDLIREGRKALEYKVKVSDVQIGGRVLSRDDDGDESSMMLAEGNKGLLSPSATMSMLEEQALWGRAADEREGLVSPGATLGMLDEAALWGSATQQLDGENGGVEEDTVASDRDRLEETVPD